MHHLYVNGLISRITKTEYGKEKILPLREGDSVIILGKKKKKNDLYEVETMYGEKGLFPVELLREGKVRLSSLSVE